MNVKDRQIAAHPKMIAALESAAKVMGKDVNQMLNAKPTKKKIPYEQRLKQRFQKQYVEKHMEEQSQVDMCWDKLKYMHSQHVQSIAANASLLCVLNSDIVEYVREPDLLREKIACLSRDLSEMSQKLNMIFNQHRNYSGSMADHEDFQLVIEMNTAYFEYTEIYQNVVLPTVQQIMALVADAEGRKNVVVNELRAIVDEQVAVIQGAENTGNPVTIDNPA